MAQAKKKAAEVVKREVVATAYSSNEAMLTAKIKGTKEAIQKHLNAICDHMNAIDEQGIEIQFGINKTPKMPDGTGGQNVVTHHFAIRRY